MSEKSPWNPSKKATARVKAPLPAPENCQHCGSPVEIAHHRDVYGRAFSDWPWMYRCTDEDCDSYVGMHPFTAIPLGTLADPATREARKSCKPPFEDLWRGRRSFLTRKEAYQALADRLGIPVGQCHFAWFDVATCVRAWRICQDLMEEHLQADRPLAQALDKAGVRHG